LASDHAGQLHLEPAQATFFMSLNTRAAPFDDVVVRRAVNFAVDRGKVQRLIGLATRPTCQILPPNFPGYVAYCPYTRRPGVAWTAPDLPKAKSLVRESGTAGTKVTVWSAPSFFPRVSSYFADLLRDLGYRVALKKVDDGEYQSALYGRPRRSQIAFAGWTTDYPAGSSFIGALFKCGVPFNDSGFCDEELNQRMARAARLQTTDLQAAYRLWTSIDHDLVDVAPSVPLVARYWVNLVSRRLGNFQVNTLGLLVDQMWVR
ncbi:MAG: peptide/nickel transport system substrate-binding protein, partial [Actinomycetota bacterium]|nr:peptide/nickel transport system substrate-binding protein [Actinomycetota bacterium]